MGAGAVLVALLFFAQYGPLTVRSVSINGYRLSPQEIAYVEQSLGTKVPNGDYWFDPSTMAWGVVGNSQPMGVLGYGGGGSQNWRQWYDVGQNYRGPFGDYMSDGQCSFVNGEPVGNC